MIIFATMAQSPFQTFSQHWMTNISCHLNTCIGQHQDIVPTPHLTLMSHLGHLWPMILVSCSGSIPLTAKGNLVSKTLTLAPKTLFMNRLHWIDTIADPAPWCMLLSRVAPLGPWGFLLQDTTCDGTTFYSCTHRPGPILVAVTSLPISPPLPDMVINWSFRNSF